MNMQSKNIELKKILLYGGTLLAVCILTSYRMYHVMYKNDTHTCTKEEQLTVAPQQYFTSQLQQEEEQVWHALASIGITKDVFEKEYQKKRPAFLRSDVPIFNKKVSNKTVSLVTTLLKENGLQPNSVSIRAYNDRSPAAASEKVIYVNEKELSKLSPDGQRFVINHEIQHILHKDTCHRWIVESIVGTDTEKLVKEKDHPLLQFSRFRERRADITAAFSQPAMPVAYEKFAQEYFDMVGDTPGVTHPKNSDRLALAKHINDYIERYNKQNNAVNIA